MQARTDAIAGTERAGQHDEAREQNPRQRAQRHEGTCLRCECSERRYEGAFGRVKAGGVALGRGRARGRLGLGSRACPHDEPVLWPGFEESPSLLLVAPARVLVEPSGSLVLGAHHCGRGKRKTYERAARSCAGIMAAYMTRR